MKKIYFTITDDALLQDKTLHPQPTKKFIPNWLKNIPNDIISTDEDAQAFEHLRDGLTVKTCPSFIDIYKEGYVILAPQDYLFRVEDNGDWGWRTPTEFENLSPENKQVEHHSDLQFINHLPDKAGVKKVFKIILPMSMHVPYGYSIRQMSIPYSYNEDWEIAYGIYKADQVNQINLQLLYKSDKKEILIKQGTPLCVYIPYKREKFIYSVVSNKRKKFLKKDYIYKVRQNGKFRSAYYRSGLHKE